jgi:lycopene cyclase domain-containing protein
MSYPELVLLAIAAATGTDLLLLRTFLLRRKAFWTSYAILGCCQLAFNAALTGPGIVRYDPSAILGPRLAYAPVEDLGFGFALILLTLACWVALGRAAAPGDRPDSAAQAVHGRSEQRPGRQRGGQHGRDVGGRLQARAHRTGQQGQRDRRGRDQ